MRTTRVIMMRTFGVLAGSLSTTLAVMVFLGVSGGLFAKALLAGEGGLTPVAVLWALSAAPALWPTSGRPAGWSSCSRLRCARGM